ncbi:MAG: AAA-like domain-containing protein [Elainellaceae cyanobacterium]
MTRLGSHRLTHRQWYRGIIVSLIQSFQLFGKVDHREWLAANQDLPIIQCLTTFVEETLFVQFPAASIYIFIDEIDSLLVLEFPTDDFFAWIRFCYNQRSHDVRYQHFNIALFGVTVPSDLIADKQHTPFNIGHAIHLDGFTFEEAAPLTEGLEPVAKNPSAMLRSILCWTEGQPFLTQKLCQLVVHVTQQDETAFSQIPDGMEASWLGGVVKSHILDNWETHDDPVHLRTIRDRLFWNETLTRRLLEIYQRLLYRESVPITDSREHVELLLAGLVVRQGDYLAIKNSISSK